MQDTVIQKFWILLHFQNTQKHSSPSGDTHFRRPAKRCFSKLVLVFGEKLLADMIAKFRVRAIGLRLEFQFGLMI